MICNKLGFTQIAMSLFVWDNFKDKDGFSNLSQ